jgi:hypothetical protein
MASPDELLDDFIAAWNAGKRPRVDDYLERAPEPERDELAGLLHAFLDQAPVPAYTRQTLAEIQAEPAVAELSALIESQAGVWPSLLPRLRRRAQLTRDQVVSALSDALGLGGREEKVKGYYHQMESGTLDPRGVSARVLESLAGVFKVTVGEIEEGGEFEVTSGLVPDAAFARSYQMHEWTAHAPAAAEDRESPGDWDEVDELFRGGR